MLDVPEEELQKVTTEKITEALLKNRSGNIKIKPGYDGEYGVPILDKKQEAPEKPAKTSPQTGLSDFV